MNPPVCCSLETLRANLLYRGLRWVDVVVLIPTGHGSPTCIPAGMLAGHTVERMWTFV